MLHSFAPRYSHPSIRHLQPSLMLGPCKPGQRRGCGRTQTFLKRFRCQLRARQANMKNPAGPKVGAETFYDVSSWQQVTKNITWDSGVSCQNQNSLYRAFLGSCDILVRYWGYVSLSDYGYRPKCHIFTQFCPWSSFYDQIYRFTSCLNSYSCYKCYFLFKISVK